MDISRDKITTGKIQVQLKKAQEEGLIGLIARYNDGTQASLDFYALSRWEFPKNNIKSYAFHKIDFNFTLISGNGKKRVHGRPGDYIVIDIATGELQLVTAKERGSYA